MLGRWVAFTAAAFMTHAIFFSFSRGGMLGLCVVGAASLYLIPKSRKNLLLIAAGFVAGLLMAGPEVVERFFTITQNSLASSDFGELEESAESRLHLWEICLRMTGESPLLGKGPDHFVSYVQNYPVETKNGVVIYPVGKEAHSLWLQIAAEIGIFGAALLGMYYLLTIKQLWPYVSLDKTDSQGLTPGATARMVTAALVGFVVSAQFVSLEGLELPYYVAIVGLGELKLGEAESIDSAVEEIPLNA
jgi:O-antigen ligase